MSEILLNRDERLSLRALAHHLNPTVLLGNQGLSEAVLKEINRALDDHELIKIKVPSDEKEERETLFADMAEKLNAARVQMIGKILILWRPNPEKAKADELKAKKRSKAISYKRKKGDPTAAKRVRAGSKKRLTKRSFFSQD